MGNNIGRQVSFCKPNSDQIFYGEIVDQRNEDYVVEDFDGGYHGCLEGDLLFLD